MMAPALLLNINVKTGVALLTLTLTAATLTAVGAHLCRKTPAEHAIDAQAAQLFEYDREHQNILPAGKLRALSIALAFDDYQGALTLILNLKKKI